jgi:glycyl-tRNA synthetase beta chain
MPANKNNDFLVEIHTEEMPPKSLNRLASSFCSEIESRLKKAELDLAEAVIVKKLAAKQADSAVERRGPAIAAAFDSAGKPTPACLGFARSCGVEPSQLVTLKTPQGEWVGF